MIRIEAPHFVAGVICQEGTVTRTAPILAYMKGWTMMSVVRYSRRKVWKAGFLP